MASLFVPDDALLKANSKLAGLCSLSRNQVIKELSREGISYPSSRVMEMNVESLTVPSLIRKFGLETIDILQIDTEGFDWKILAKFNLAAHNVRLINMEFFHLHLDEQVDSLSRLTNEGFAMAKVLGDLVAYRCLE